MTPASSPFRFALTSVVGLLSAAAWVQAADPIKVTKAHSPRAEATAEFKLKDVPPPLRSDAGFAGTWSVIDGNADRNGGGTAKLNDGALPVEEDDPGRNFFFQGPEGGRMLLDLGQVIEVGQVRSYSWHADWRAPQRYRLYASDGAAAGFEAKPKRPVDLTTVGWKLVAEVDTRPPAGGGDPGGQYGVAIGDGSPGFGKARYLLFDVLPNVDRDVNSNTFFSEIDVTDRTAPPATELARASVEALEIAGGQFRVYLDLSETPELAEWAHTKLMPAVVEWYPKIVAMLPSTGYAAPKRFGIQFKREMDGVAFTRGTQVVCAYPWYAKNLQGEGVGSVIHELVHVVQQYRSARPPIWLGEGIPDYIRFYLFEPQTHGAVIRPNNAARARYDASYRTSANFLEWTVRTYDPEMIAKLNADLRAGKYEEGLWKKLTGKTVQELAEEWKAALEAGK